MLRPNICLQRNQNNFNYLWTKQQLRQGKQIRSATSASLAPIRKVLKLLYFVEQVIGCKNKGVWAAVGPWVRQTAISGVTSLGD